MQYQNPYIVKEGETLWGIAKAFGYTVDYLYEHDWNHRFRKDRPIKNHIQPGDKIWLPPKPILPAPVQTVDVATTIDITLADEESSNVLRLPSGVRFLFVYDDIPDDEWKALQTEPLKRPDYLVSERPMLYWQYDDTGTKIDTVTPLRSLGQQFPQGYGYIRSGLMQPTLPYQLAFDNLSIKPGAVEGTFWRDQRLPFLFGQANSLDVAGYLGAREQGKALYDRHAFNQFHLLADDPQTKSRQSYYLRFDPFGRPYIDDAEGTTVFDKDPFQLIAVQDKTVVADYYHHYPVDLSPNSRISNLYTLSGDYKDALSPETFESGKKYGFFLFPPDMGGYLSKSLLDLAKTNVLDRKGEPVPHRFVATEVETQSPDQGSIQLVRVHATLPEWDYRISNQIKRLEEATENYLKRVQEDQKALSLLRDIKNFAAIHLKYPYERQTQANIDNKQAFIKKLAKMEQWITDAFIVPKNKNKMTAHLLRRKEQEAKALWELVGSPAFLAELSTYQTADEGNFNPDRGPYAHYEPNWTRIYMTLAKAYRLLAYTPYAQTVYDKKIEPILDYLGSIAKKIVIEKKDVKEISQLLNFDNHDKDFVNHFSAFKNALASERSIQPDPNNELLSGILTYLNFTAKVLGQTVTNAPGPPSLFLELLDVYGVFAFKSLQGRAKQKTIKMSRAFKALVFLLEKVENRKYKEEDIKPLLTAIFGSKSHLRKGLQVFNRFKTGPKDEQTQFFTDKIFSNANESRQFKLGAKCYKGALALLGVFNSAIAAEEYLRTVGDKDFPENLKYTADVGIDIAGTTSGVLLWLSKFDKLNASYGHFFKGVKLVSEKFNVYVNFYFAAMSAIECGVELYNGNGEKALIAGLNAGASLMLPIGYMLVAAGAVPGLGHALLIIGLTIQLGLLLWPSIRAMFYSESFLQLESKIEAFETLQVHGRETMKRYAGMSGQWKEAKKLWKSITWQKLSWRAIVPLYLEQYDLKTIQRLVTIGIRAKPKPLTTRESLSYAGIRSVQALEAAMEPYRWDVDEILAHYRYLLEHEEERLPGREKENGYYAKLMTLGVYDPEEYPELSTGFPNDLFHGFEQETMPVGSPPEDFPMIPISG